MKIKEIITAELLERYQYRLKPVVARRYVSRPAPRRPVASAKPITKLLPLPKPKPLPARPQSAKKQMVAASQTKGLNPKIDIQNGSDFKLDNFNPMSPMTDVNRKIYAMDRI
jgi:hypothetical protein